MSVTIVVNSCSVAVQNPQQGIVGKFFKTREDALTFAWLLRDLILENTNYEVVLNYNF